MRIGSAAASVGGLNSTAIEVARTTDEAGSS
jgi:hypothetical protein